MSKNKELWNYSADEKVWVGKYQNSQNISHWHNDCELLYVNNGNLEVMVDGNLFSLKEGDALFVESQKIHNMHATSENTITSIIIFDNSLVKKIFDLYELEQPLLTNDYKIPAIYNELLNELITKPLFYENNTKAIIQKLIIEILRNEKLIKRKKNKKIDEKLMFLINDINENYRYYTFDRAASTMNMNPSYFSRFFHNIIGISFAKYLNCVKVEKAVALINDNSIYQITEIADLCGFQTIRNFNRIFKEFTGYTPTNIPNNYVFNGLKFNYSNNAANPTLTNCKLIEFSSPHH
jgi:AraC-like DNA-binding protein